MKNSLRKILAGLVLASILVTGCGAAQKEQTTAAEPANTEQAAEPAQTTEAAEPAQTTEAAEPVEEATEEVTAEQAEQVAEEAVEQTTTQEQAEQVLIITYPDGGYVEVTRTEEGLLVKTSAGDEFPMTGNMPWDTLPFGETVEVDDLDEPFLTAFRDFPH